MIYHYDTKLGNFTAMPQEKTEIDQMKAHNQAGSIMKSKGTMVLPVIQENGERTSYLFIHIQSINDRLLQALINAIMTTFAPIDEGDIHIVETRIS